MSFFGGGSVQSLCVNRLHVLFVHADVIQEANAEMIRVGVSVLFRGRWSS